MRSLFLFIEQSLGPSLATVSAVVYWAAIVLLAHRILAPILRLRMEIATARLRMEERMVMECPHCHRETVVADSQCAFCRQSLATPLDLRIWHFMRMWHQPMWFRWTRWSWDIIGLVIFIALTVVGFVGLRGWTSSGPLQQLFLGVAIFCWVAIGWLVARVLHVGREGPIARLRDLVFSFAIAWVLAVSVFFAVESTAVPETVMWRIPVGEGGIAKIEDKGLLLPQGMIGFEYLQVDHELIGFHRVIPIAFLGNERLEVTHGGTEKWLLDNLWKHMHGYSERGLSVRSRVEQFIVVPNREYEVVDRDKQVYFRPVAQ